MRELEDTAAGLAGEAVDRLQKGIQIRAEVQSSAALQHVLQCGRRGAIQALLTLAETDADDTKAIQDAQHDLHRYLGIAAWLNQAVSEGEDAEHEIKDRGEPEQPYD